MEWLDSIRRRLAAQPPAPTSRSATRTGLGTTSSPTATTGPIRPPRLDLTHLTASLPVPISVEVTTSGKTLSGERWYVPAGGDPDRFVARDGGAPQLHIIEYESGGERVLRLCEDSTGLLVGPTNRRLSRAGIYVSNLRGTNYHRAACTAGDFRPGVPVRLVREPDNPYDASAVAVTRDTDNAPVAAYVNKQKARTLARLLDAGSDFRAISLRGTGPRRVCEAISILVAAPEVVAHLLSPRPEHLPQPVCLRG